MLAAGDVIFNATNSPDLVGKTALLGSVSELTVYSNHFLRLRTNPRQLSPAYLAHWLRTQFRAGVFKSMCRQWVNQATVAKDDLLSLKIPLPSIEDQRRIADVLDRVDALRDHRRRAIALLDDLSQSIFLDMFGDPTSEPSRWKGRTLSDLVTEFRYGTSQKSGPAGLPTLRIPNVVGGVVDASDLKLVPASASGIDRLRLLDGDILFVRTNGNPDYVGRCAVFTRDAVALTGLRTADFIYASYLIRARLRTDLVEPVFVKQFMLGPAGRRALRERSKTSAGQYNINIQGLGGIRLAVPPVTLQREFGSRIAAVGLMKLQHIAQLAELDGLFAAVQHRAFRGELWDDPAE